MFRIPDDWLDWLGQQMTMIWVLTPLFALGAQSCGETETSRRVLYLLVFWGFWLVSYVPWSTFTRSTRILALHEEMKAVQGFHAESSQQVIDLLTEQNRVLTEQTQKDHERLQQLLSEKIALLDELIEAQRDGQNWREIRGLVHVLDAETRPGSQMADDDVLDVVARVLRRAAQKEG